MLKLSGRSSNVVVFEAGLGWTVRGDVDARGSHVRFVVGDEKGGVAVVMTYAPVEFDVGAVWSAVVSQIGDGGVPIPWTVSVAVADPPRDDQPAYSVEVTIGCPNDTPFVIQRCTKGIWAWRDYARFDGTKLEQVS